MSDTSTDMAKHFAQLLDERRKGGEYAWMTDEALKQAFINIQAENARLREALERILSTVSLDWYVQHFARSQAASSIDTGVSATIHNAELIARIREAFERAREALEKVKG